MTYFDNVIGQDTIKNHLTELVKRQTLPHSLLFYGEAGLGKLDMAIGLASLILGRQVFPGHNGAEYLDEVKNARLANGESEKKIEAEGLPIYMDKGDAFWIRPMKSTLKVEQWYSYCKIIYLLLVLETASLSLKTFTWPMLLWRMPC